MHSARSTLLVVLALGIAGSGMALAQSTPPSDKPPPAASSTSDEAKAWTKKKWSEMKAKWATEKVKYADCRKQAKEQKLTRTQGWRFTADCMTK